MPARSAWFRFGGRLGAGVLVCTLAYGGPRAELLNEYFPNGVPGYGTAPGVTVLSRQRPSFDPVGVRTGSLVLHPQVDEGLGYDSNVFGSGNRAPGSWLVGSHPSLLVGSDWSRNSIGAYVGASDLRYLDLPRQSFTDWTTSLGGTLSVGRDQLTLAAAHLQLHQPRTDLDALPSDTPVAYQVNDMRASYLMSFGRFSVTPSLAFTTYNYVKKTGLHHPDNVSQVQIRDRVGERDLLSKASVPGSRVCGRGQAPKPRSGPSETPGLRSATHPGGPSISRSAVNRI